MLIAFCGATGAGKTTLIRNVRTLPYFRGREVSVAEEDNFFSINLLKAIFGENLLSQYKREKFFRQDATSFVSKCFSLFVYIVYPIFVYIELFIAYIYYSILFKEKVLLSDRYAYDYLVNFTCLLQIGNRITRYFFINFPRPDLLFFLDIDVATSLARNKNTSEGFITMTRSFHEEVIQMYRKIAKKKDMVRIDSTGSVKSATEEVKQHLLRRKKLLRARQIAICGLDGAGKTTAAHLLCESSEGIGVSCKVVHFYHNNILDKILKKVKLLAPFSPKGVFGSVYVRKRPFLWALLHFSDSYVQYLFSVFFNRKRLIIFDRFFYDYLVSFRYFNISNISLFEKWIPPIGHKFVLMTDPHTSYGRKPEKTRRFFQYAHEAYGAQAQRHNLTVINTYKKTPELIVQEMIDSIDL